VSNHNGDVADLLTEDAVFDVPYADASAMEMPVRGREAFAATFAWVVAELFDPFLLEPIEEYLGADPEVLIVEYRSEGAIKANGSPYANRYVGVFRIRDGKIALWREYYNPEVMTRAAGTILHDLTDAREQT
jgi:uncharacterized protein